MNRRIATAFLGSISLAALCAPAHAAVETVVVTAEKRVEDVKDVPMAVTVLSGEKLARQNLTNFDDYVNTVPGMNFTASEPGHTQLILRGINAGGVGATIGTYVDETPYGSSSALANGTITTPNIDTFDIARIEVLRGPQGTLYGSSTLGGLLKIVTNAPSTDEVEGKVQAGISDVDNGGTGFSLKGMLNVPVDDSIAFRVTAYTDFKPGFVDDPVRGVKNLNWARETGGRAALQINVTNDFNIRFTAVAQDIGTGGNSSEDLTVVGPDYAPTYGTYQQARTTPTPGYAHYRVYNGTMNYDLGWASLVSSTSYDTFKDLMFQDGTGVYGLDIDGRLGQKKFTQELRLASPDQAGPLEWLAGFYYTHENAGLRQNLVTGVGAPTLAFLELDSKYIETAGFANLTYHFSDQFDVAIGGRYSHNSQSALEFGLASAAGVSDGDVFTWSVAPSYHLDDQTVLYARAAKGYRPGGPNALPPIVPPGVPTFYGADSLINYELGVKTDLLDGQLSIDADVFLINWSDIQLLVVSGGFAVNANGPSARSQGFEWNVTWRPLDELSVVFGGAYTDAHLTADTDPILVGALSGARLPWAPKWNTSLDAEYTFDNVGDVRPFIGGSWRYVGERKSDFGGFVVAPTPNQFDVGSYNRFDARVGVEWDKWTFEVYGKNLNNSKGITGFAPSGTTAASGFPIPGNAALITPRTIGVTVGTTF
jgi:outer membrane receptor protein involved in Fe transport